MFHVNLSLIKTKIITTTSSLAVIVKDSENILEVGKNLPMGCLCFLHMAM